jgi:uncharacterized protein YneF (UPF0154 family)
MADTKKVLIWVGAGCGTLVLLAGLSCVGCVFYARKRMADDVGKNNPQLAAAIRQNGLTGGVRASGGQLVASGVAIYGSTIAAASLPKDEQRENGAILEHLVKVGGKLTPEDIQILSQAMERTQKAHRTDRGLPTAEEARVFFSDVKAVADRYQP